MKFPHGSVFLLLAASGAAFACSDDGGSSSDTENEAAAPVEEMEEEEFVTAHPLPAVPTFESGLDRERLLDTLSDEEIGDACLLLAETMNTADEQIACQLVSTVEQSDEDSCVEKRTECLEDPEEALAAVTLSPAPAPIDCSIFSAELAAGCAHPLGVLEDCINAMAASVAPPLNDYACETAAENSDLAAVDSAAALGADTTYLAVCLPLTDCGGLIGALLGPGEMGAGGATNQP